MIDFQTEKTVRNAMKRGDFQSVVQLLGEDETLRNGMTLFGTWLHVAADLGKLDIVRWLVSQGADINAEGGSIEGSPLHSAASSGHLEVVDFLLECGATFDTSQATRNPLIGSILGGISNSHTAVAKLLIEKGIDTQVRYPVQKVRNMSALDFARDWGRTDIAALLETIV